MSIVRSISMCSEEFEEGGATFVESPIKSWCPRKYEGAETMSSLVVKSMCSRNREGGRVTANEPDLLAVDAVPLSLSKSGSESESESTLK